MAEYIIGEPYRLDIDRIHVARDFTIYEKTLTKVFMQGEEPEQIVRCRDCEHRWQKGWKLDEFSNAAKRDFCSLCMDHDYDYDYTTFYYVEPDDYCSMAKPRKEGTA